MKCEYVTFLWWFRGGSTNNPLGSIGIFILKDSILPKFCIYPVWEKRVKIWNNKIPNGEFQNGDDARRDFNDAFVWPPFTCATTAHFLSSSSCGSTSASNHFDLQAIHKKNSQNRTMKLERSKNSDMAVTALHDQKCSNSGAPRTGTRSGRLHKARWEKEANDGLLHASFVLWLFVILFSFHCISCFSNKSIGGVVG